MAGVTIQGGASLAQGIQTIHMGSAVNAQIAQSLLDSANAGILDGTVKTYRPSYWSGNTAQFLNVPTLNNVLFIPNVINAGTVAVPSTQTSVVFDYATVADTVSGGSAAQQLLVTGNFGGTYITNTGVGTVIAGDGNNVVVSSSTTTGGGHVILTGAGNDSIDSQTGNDTIDAGGGNDTITLGTGNDYVKVEGADTIFAGAGADTVDVSAGTTALVQAGDGNLNLINAGGAATVFGDVGSVTVDGGGGASGSYYSGGGAGNNSLVGGLTGATTLYGGGEGDTLVAQGSGTNVLLPGNGNETLISSGTGSDSLYGAPYGGNYTFVISADQAGGSVFVSDFTVGQDTMSMLGYSASVQDAVDAKITDALAHSGSADITLGDGTKITFSGVTKLS